MKAVTWAIGGVAAGLVAMLITDSIKSPPPVDHSKMIDHSPVYLSIDPLCASELIRLQGYSLYAKEYFEVIVDFTDQLLLYVKTYSEGKIPWNQSYQQEAMNCYLKVEQATEEFIKCARHWLYTIPYEGYKALLKTDDDYKKKEQELAGRIEAGLKDFRDIVSLKENIVGRLRYHLLNLGIRDSTPSGSADAIVEAQYASQAPTSYTYGADYSSSGDVGYTDVTSMVAGQTDQQYPYPATDGQTVTQ
jgi:hypothetical protein